MSSLTVAAPAKLNLWLKVLGRRDDGYHCLDSLVAFLDVRDTVHLMPADDLGLTLSGPMAPALVATAAGTNLSLQAARALQHATGITAGVHIHLEKHIPVAAGLGGGSADAAATLVGLCCLWRLSLTPPELAAIALTLGADVPACVIGRPVRVGGIGADVTPVENLPSMWIVLVNPRQDVATKAVFAAHALAPNRPREVYAAPGSLIELTAQCRRLGNDLTAAAVAVAPAIGQVLTLLAHDRTALASAMSGSGATCFALYDSAAAAAAAASAISQAQPGWWVMVARPHTTGA